VRRRQTYICPTVKWPSVLLITKTETTSHMKSYKNFLPIFLQMSIVFCFQYPSKSHNKKYKATIVQIWNVETAFLSRCSHYSSCQPQFWEGTLLINIWSVPHNSHKCHCIRMKVRDTPPLLTTFMKSQGLGRRQPETDTTDQSHLGCPGQEITRTVEAQEAKAEAVWERKNWGKQEKLAAGGGNLN